jgi:glycosyltransferase involved in cell wall biosynthesis
MATYNGEKYVKEQLASILSQLSENDEIIISDDNSSDSTLDIIKGLNDRRISVVLNEKPAGYTKNFENTLEKATGDVIFLADQDDVWLSNKVSITLSYLKKYDFVVSDCTIVDADLNTLAPSHFNIHNVRTGFMNNFLLPRYIGACMAFKKEVLSTCLPFPEKQKFAAHDYWISQWAELRFSTVVINEPLILYRRHGSNASNGGTTSKNSLVHKLTVRGYTLLFLFINWMKKCT